MSAFKRSLQERHIFPENGEIAPSRRAWKPTAEQVDIGQYLLMFIYLCLTVRFKEQLAWDT